MPKANQTDAEQREHATQGLYQALFENSPYCVHELDLKGRICAMNPVGMQWAGASDPKNIIGAPFLSLVSDQDRDHAELYLHRAVQGEQVRFDYTDRAEVQYTTVLVPIMDDDNVRQVLGLTQNVTEETRIEQRLTELEMQHALILESAGEGIHGLDAEGRVTFANSAAEKILGWDSDQILGKMSHDLHHHSHADGSKYPRERCPIYAALKDGQVHRVDNEVFWHTDGSAVPVEYTSTPILKDGKPVGAVVVFRDISSRKQAEKQREAALRELERLTSAYQAILDSAGEGIYGLDRSGCVTFGNRAATEILGWQSKEVLGRPGHAVHHHSYADGSTYPPEKCPIYATLEDGEVHRVDDEVFWRSDGTPVPVEYTGTPILQDGKPDGAVIVFRDISERRALEAQRQAAFAEIKKLNEQLEQERDYLRDEVNEAMRYGDIIGDTTNHRADQRRQNKGKPGNHSQGLKLNGMGQVVTAGSGGRRQSGYRATEYLTNSTQQFQLIDRHLLVIKYGGSQRGY